MSKVPNLWKIWQYSVKTQKLHITNIAVIKFIPQTKPASNKNHVFASRSLFSATPATGGPSCSNALRSRFFFFSIKTDLYRSSWKWKCVSNLEIAYSFWNILSGKSLLLCNFWYFLYLCFCPLRFIFIIEKRKSFLLNEWFDLLNLKNFFHCRNDQLYFRSENPCVIYLR